MTPGTNPNFVTLEQDTSTISASAPVSSISTSSRSQSPVKQKALQAGDSDRLPKKVNRGKDRLSAIKSPENSAVRRSPRHMVWTNSIYLFLFASHLMNMHMIRI